MEISLICSFSFPVSNYFHWAKPLLSRSLPEKGLNKPWIKTLGFGRIFQHVNRFPNELRGPVQLPLLSIKRFPLTLLAVGLDPNGASQLLKLGTLCNTF